MRSGLLSAGVRRRVVNVLDSDPDLADGVPREELAEARERALAPLVAFDAFGP
jgi:hypothetical protein